jgi:excisionase family DNA binding protein
VNLELGPQDVEAIAAALAPRVAALLKAELQDAPAREPRALTVEEAAERANVSVGVIRRAYGSGRLPYHRPEGTQLIRILDVDVDAWRLQPGTRRAQARPAAAPAKRARRAQVARIDSRRRAEPGSREDLRAIERGMTS